MPRLVLQNQIGLGGCGIAIEVMSPNYKQWDWPLIPSEAFVGFLRLTEKLPKPGGRHAVY